MDNEKLVVIAIIILAAVGLINAYVYTQGPAKSVVKNISDGSDGNNLEPSQEPSNKSGVSVRPFFVPTAGFVKQDVLQVEGNIIVVGSGCSAIVAPTSEERAAAIQEGQAGQVAGRPTVYDGWAAMLETFGIKFDAATVYGVDEGQGAYLSKGYFQFGADVTELDMKPSDALALALRTKTPVYMNQTLLDERGTDICQGQGVNETG